MDKPLIYSLWLRKLCDQAVPTPAGAGLYSPAAARFISSLMPAQNKAIETCAQVMAVAHCICSNANLQGLPAQGLCACPPLLQLAIVTMNSCGQGAVFSPKSRFNKLKRTVAANTSSYHSYSRQYLSHMIYHSSLDVCPTSMHKGVRP